MQIAICDADKISCTNLIKWIKRYSKKEKIKINVEDYYSAESLLDKVKEKQWYDLIFMEIELPQKNGIELGHELRKCMDEKVSIIYISHQIQYCVDLFSIEPQNFHKKPLTEAEIIQDIEKAIMRSKKHKNVLKYIDGGVMKGIPISNILYIKAEDKYVKVVIRDGDPILIRDSIKRLAKDYYKYKLYQCHKSYIVNMNYVKKYRNYKLYINDIVINVGRKFSQEIKHIYLEKDK